MKKYLVIIFLFNCFNTFSQNKKISGIVQDSTLNIFIQNASVVLLNFKDSIILSDIRSLSNGEFRFSNIKKNQNYILFISYPGYVSLSKEIIASDKDSLNFNLGTIFLTSQGTFLKEVVVKSTISGIQLRGDTLQYATSEMILPPNSSVEDLLKRLPGLQVDPNGRITAQGKKVKKVLVDGEEFFSDDPVFVTRNLRSEMIAKVQIYDKKSDVALFTGVDDGIKDKVINLRLKQDKSNGLFGKVEAGSGKGYQNSPYSTNAMLNSFKDKQKLSVYLSSNNIGLSGLGPTEKNQMGVTNEMEKYDGKGLPEFSSSGLHFDNKWNKDRFTFNGDYYYSISNISGFDSTFTYTILPTGDIKKYTNTIFQKEGFNHKSNFTYKQQVGQSGTISLNTIISYNKGASFQQSNAFDIDVNQQYLNRSKNQNKLRNESLRIQNAILFQHKFKKLGKTISISIEQQSNNSNEQQINLTTTDFFNGKPLIDSIVALDLIKQKDQALQILNGGISYSDRINKSLTFILSINSTLETADANNLSNRFLNPIGGFDSLFSTIRNDIRSLYTGNLSFSFARKKFRASIGGGAGTSRVDIKNLVLGKNEVLYFEVWKPFGRLQYSFSDNKSLSMSYRGNSVGPGFQEISPYSFNNSQLVTFYNNFTINNAFSNNLSMSYESFKSLTKAFTGLVLKHSSTQNPIKTLSNINSSGAYFFQYVNMTGFVDRELEVTGFYSRPILPVKIQLTLDLSYKSGQNFSYINGALNKLNYNITSTGLLFSKSKTSKYDFLLSGTLYYDINSLQEASKTTPNKFFTYKLKSSIDYFLMPTFQLHTDAEYFRQGKSNVFSNSFERMIWNAWVSKNFLNNNQLTVKFSVNDLLNSNVGFSRSASSIMFSENVFQTIQRYFLLTCIWNFTKYKQLKQ
ncbi:MAG: outer membrane beta-barrel protein [Sediminibacterium sp.]|nr:outer membrane beta-barrel protein [Sediminibacterium sp.]